jgi:hypothetical protein
VAPSCGSTPNPGKGRRPLHSSLCAVTFFVLFAAAARAGVVTSDLVCHYGSWRRCCSWRASIAVLTIAGILPA